METASTGIVTSACAISVASASVSTETKVVPKSSDAVLMSVFPEIDGFTNAFALKALLGGLVVKSWGPGKVSKLCAESNVAMPRR